MDDGREATHGTRALLPCLVALLSAVFFSSVAGAALTLTESSIKASLVVDTKKPNTDRFTLRATFQNGVSDSITPATEPVVVTVGPFSQTLPPGALKPQQDKSKKIWTFKGNQAGLKLLFLTQTGQNWTLEARANSINLSATANPITIKLQIGDDTGSRSLFFVVSEKERRKLFKFPAGKKDDADGDGFTPKEGDCDDQEPTTYPGAPELCDAIDNNCNKSVDEGFDLGAACSAGVGVCQRSGVKVCSPDESTTICNATPGTPGEELCGNALDDDCDGTTDEGFDVGTVCAAGVGACQRSGVKMCSSDRKTTVCDATPGTPTTELCGNTIDDDCDGSTDEGFDVGAACTVGVGACERGGTKICTADGSGTSCNATPGSPTAEVCNNVDDNCNGQTDEGLGTISCG